MKYVFDYETFKNYRKAIATQQTMALSLGVSRITIQNLESGKHQPKADLYFRICELFDLDVYDLMQLGGKVE